MRFFAGLSEISKSGETAARNIAFTFATRRKRFMESVNVEACSRSTVQIRYIIQPCICINSNYTAV